MSAFDEVSGDARNLAVLVATATEIAIDFPPEPDAYQDHMNRVCSLLWIARDLAEKLAEDAEEAARLNLSVRVVEGVKCNS